MAYMSQKSHVPVAAALNHECCLLIRLLRSSFSLSMHVFCFSTQFVLSSKVSSSLITNRNGNLPTLNRVLRLLNRTAAVRALLLPALVFYLGGCCCLLDKPSAS